MSNDTIRKGGLHIKRVIIDTDTASDDAVALVMALREPEIKVEAITVVAGNVPLPTAVYNACMSVEYAQSYRPPIYAGMSRPLIRDVAITATHVHGQDGMGDVGTFKKPEIKPESEHGVDALIRLIGAASEGEIDLITLGPLTNIAMAIRRAPEVMCKLKHITMMAGLVSGSNGMRPYAEYNMYADPEAADIVCGFGVPFTMCTLEACGAADDKEAAFTADEVEELLNSGSELARFCVECNRALVRFRPLSALILADPTAIAVFMHPEIIKESFEAYTRIELRGERTYGTTVSDRNGWSGKPYNSLIVGKLHGKAFKDYVRKLIV